VPLFFSYLILPIFNILLCKHARHSCVPLRGHDLQQRCV
jgi:hypothetical protein